jgi:CRISPR system Cascade subunit CasD
MQSWGSAVRFKNISTEQEPTKSGVVGLVVAALGREREESLDDLAGLRFGVRVDQPGKLLSDYHTAQIPNKNTSISTRHYLCDAVFVVGLESDDEELLDRIKAALEHPRFPLYLGRRSCPPAGPLVLGRESLPLEQALQKQKWQASTWHQRRLRKKQQIKLDLVMDAEFGSVGSFTRRDFPLTFNQEYRRYSFRSLRSDIEAVSVSNPKWTGADGMPAVGRTTQQDPFAALEVE